MISVNERFTKHGLRLPALDPDGREDIAKESCLQLAVRSAFPLPDSGSFKDLLAAIDELDWTS